MRTLQINAQSEHNRSWLLYFRKNAKDVLKVTKRKRELTDRERDRIATSIQKFQVGEASEGKHLKKRAWQYAKRSGDVLYPEIIEYFIREENRHSAYLGTFMKANDIPLARKTWTDSVFRFLRNLAGLELSLRVLVTAELIALLYYRCLAQCTGSRILRLISNRMSQEEHIHVQFQMEMIQRLSHQKWPSLRRMSNWGHALLMYGTLIVVWFEHAPVLRAEFHFSGFVRMGFGLFQRYLKNGRYAILRSNHADTHSLNQSQGHCQGTLNVPSAVTRRTACID